MTDVAVINTGKPLAIINNQVAIQVGAQGAQGAPGRGILPGGTTGQLLAKASNVNYDTHWVDPTSVQALSVIAVAGEVISALRVVYTDPATSKILYADKDTPNTVNSLLGVTIQAGSEDDEVNVLTAGVLQDSSWNWNMAGNLNLFLGANGAIVQGALSGAVVVRIGNAISSTEILVRIGESIITT